MNSNDTTQPAQSKCGWRTKLAAIKYLLFDKIWPLQELPKLKKIRNCLALLAFVATLVVASIVLPGIVLFCTDGSGIILSHTLLSFMFSLCFMVLALFNALFVYRAFSFFMRTALPKAIRLSSAMRMLHAEDNTRACDIIKMYGISVYETAKKLGDEAEFELPCKYVSGFMDPWTYRSFQDAAFGSGNFCCNLDEIETIIQTNQRHWGGSQISATDLNETLIAGLHKQIAEITKEKEQAFNDLKGARGRLGKAEKQLAECETHMGILVRLASVVTEPQPPQKVSQKEIKEKYLAIGNTLGVDVVPPKYVDIFRNSMPVQYINQGGAPNQGEKAEKP